MNRQARAQLPASARPATREPVPSQPRRRSLRDSDDAQCEAPVIENPRAWAAGPASCPAPSIAPYSPGPTPDFARLSASAGGTSRGIDDAHAARAVVTQLLLDELASTLGLDPKRITLNMDCRAEARVNAAGASALQDGTTIYLHPARYQPNSERGRYLLAHETVHVAQRGLAGRGDVQAAEYEAATLGRAFAERRPLAPPRIALHEVSAVADAGAGDPPLPSADPAVVSVSRSREIAEIRKSLSGLWISDGDVFDVMRILDSVSFPVASAIVCSLSEKERYELADNVNPPHVYDHRRSVLVCYYQTLSDGRLQDAVDLKVFRALPTFGLSSEETEAAAYTLMHLKDEQRRDLLSSDNGRAIGRIISAPRLSAQELERIQTDARNASADEAKQAEKRRHILAHADDRDAKALLEQVTQLLSPDPAAGSQAQPDGASAIRALDVLGERLGDESLFDYVAEQLEFAGLIDQLLQLLPASSYFDHELHAATLIRLVHSRLPYKNEKLVEDLLSYGLFDWAVRDYEAMFAYRLIKLLPLGEQYRFRMRDAGKWYLRLLENLPDDGKYPGLEIRKAETKEELDELKAKYRALAPNDSKGLEVDNDKLYYSASQLYEAKLAKDPGAKRTMEALTADFEEKKKDPTTLYRELVTLGGASLEPGREKPADQVLRESVIHELDRLGYIDRLFGDLPESFLFAEENRVSTVKIMLARDPARVQAHARELVSRGFTDWMVTDGEAYLAYMCIKALPQDERDAFIEHNATEWGRIQGEMSESMRQSRDLNFYIGDKAGTDRASVLGRLSESSTWTDNNASLVGDLVRMAIAMTEHRFAFERSKEFEAHKQPKLVPLVEKYRLWDPQKCPKYQPDQLERTHWYEEGVFADLKTLWSGLVTLWNLDILMVKNKVGLKVDLNDVQNAMGGDLMGAKLGDPKQRRAQQGIAHEDANKLTLLVGLDGKSADLVLPELLIDSANLQLGGSTLQSGAITLKGLEIHAAYDSEDLGQPTQARAELRSLQATDLLLAKSGSMITVTKLVVSALRLAAGTVDTITGGNNADGKPVGIPFPLLVVPMLPMLMLLALPVFLYKKIVGLAKEGLESNPADKFAADVAARTKAIEFTLGSLDVDSITTSGGEHVGHAAIRNFALRLGLNKATRLRAEKASINQRLEALAGKTDAAEMMEKLKVRKAEIETQQVRVEKDEQEYLRIQKQILSGGLTPDQQGKLQERLNALNFEDKGAAFVDIGSVEASDVSGTVQSKEPIQISSIHGEGGGAALTQMLAMPTVTDAELSRRSAGGERPAAPLGEQGDANLQIELGSFKTTRLEFGGGIRTVKDIADRVAELEPIKTEPDVAPLYQSLVALLPKARLYQAMIQVGISQLDAKQFDEFKRLRAELTAQASLIVQSIELTRARIEVDLAKRQISVGADIARIQGVQMPERGLEIKEVYAEDLNVGATVGGDIMGFLDWRKNLRTGDLGATLLKLSGVSDAKSGIGAEEIAISGLHASVDTNQGDATARVGGTVVVTGASTKFSQYALEQTLQRLQKRDRESLPPDKRKIYDTRLKEVTDFLKTLYDLQTLIAKDSQTLHAATTDAERAEAQRLLDMDRANLEEWDRQLTLHKLTVSDLNLEISGLGDILSPGYSVEAALDKGVRISGAGPKGQMFKSIKAETASYHQGPHTESTIGDVEVGSFRGAIDYSTSRIHVDGKLESASVAGLNYHSPGTEIWSDGKSELKGLTLSVTVHQPPKNKDGQPSNEPLKIDVDEFHIDSIEANHMGYKDTTPDSGLQVDIASGRLRDIWVRSVDIELPADEFADMVVHEDSSKATKGKPSGVGVGGTDNVALVAKTAEGLTASGTLNAGLLTTHFADNGDKEINLQYLKFTGGRLTQQDLDANFNTTITGIRVSLLSGGNKRVSADDIELHAGGSKGKTQFATDIEHAKTGEIEFDAKSNMIRAPNVSLPSIKISRLHLEGESYTLDIPSGQVAELVGTSLNLEIERNPSPQKGESSIRKIYIRELKVPFTALRGCAVTLLDEDGEDLTITLPTGLSGGVENIWIKPTADQANAFTITPDEGWSMVGGLSFDRAGLVGVGAKLPGVFDATANIKASGFYMGFLTDGTSTIYLNNVVATEIAGQIKGSKFSMLTGKTRYGNAGLTASGIHKSKTGLAIDELGAMGFVYENSGLGLTLDIQSATLSGPGGGLQMPDKGPIKIPKLAIDNAYFRIDDLMAMGGTGVPSAPSKVDADLLDFLDTLNGDIDLVIHADADYIRNLTSEFPLRIRIDEGQINYAVVENQLFSDSTVLQQAIDFEYDNGRLFVQLDLKTLLAAVGLGAGALGGAAGLGAGAASTKDLYGWDLQTYDSGINEQELAKTKKKVRLKSLIRPFLPDGTPSAPGTSTPLPLNINDLNVVVSSISLGLKGRSVVDLAHLNKSGLKGKIRLGAPGLDAVTAFTVKGDMKAGFALGLEEANVSVDGLAIEGDVEPSKKRKGVTTKTDMKLSTGNIHIGALTDASLSFDKGWTGSLKHLQIFPKKLEGTVSSATADDIEVTRTTTKTGVPSSTGAKK